MSLPEAIEKLRDQIRHHDKQYYVLGESDIPDVEYDKLFQRLVLMEINNPELVTDDSPTQRVGGAPIEGLESVAHLVPMMSVDNGFDMTVLDKFHERVTKVLGHEPLYALDWKIDGCAISLIYEDGKLIRAVSRGDGIIGDDITHNAVSIRGIPSEILNPVSGGKHAGYNLSVDGIIEVRGEAYIPNSVFRSLVAAQEAAGEEPFKNSRNAAAGALRQRDPKACYERKLYFVAHGLGAWAPDLACTSWQWAMLMLNELGIPMITDSQGAMTYEQAKHSLSLLTKQVDEIDYPVDGLVLKVDNLADREALGSASSKYVSWAIAYKWERYEAETKIIRLETQVGKQGTLTPVAYYEPVEIAETTVQKSTLFNFDEVKRLDPRVGDTVTLEKAGKIIPHLVRVHKLKRPEKTKKFTPPKKCPVCKGDTAKEGPLVVCTNTAGCPAQLAAVIRSAADRTRMDIDGLGPSAIEAMMDAGAITDFSSLWALEATVGPQGCIPGMTAGKSKKLLKALEEAKTRPSWRLLASLNIKHCGRTVSELVCKAVHEHARKGENNVLGMLGNRWTMQKLQSIEGVGAETAISIRTWFDRERNLKLVNKLWKAGVNCGPADPKPEAAPTGAQPFAGMAICATGRFESYTRESIRQAIVERGGKAQSSLSKGTNILVAGDKAGGKLDKAHQLGIKVVDEAEFKELAGSA